MVSKFSLGNVGSRVLHVNYQRAIISLLLSQKTKENHA